MDIRGLVPGTKRHAIQNRNFEIILGGLLFILGALLLYDSYDARGKKLPWPAGAITPW